MAVAGVLVAWLVIGARNAAHREHRRIRAVAPVHVGGLDHYELAFLAGGPRRVINTAIAVLARGGDIRVSRGARVSPVHGVPPSSEPVEQAVLDVLAAHPGGMELADLRRAVGGSEAMERLRYGLIGRGLLVPDGAFTPVRTYVHRLLAVSGGAIVVAVLMMALVAAGPPVASFASLLGVVLAGATGVGGLVAARNLRRALRNVVSTAGHAELTAARRLHRRGAAPVGPGLAYAVGLPVALYGLNELDDAALQEELLREEARSQAVSTSAVSGACGGGGTFGGGDYGTVDSGWGGLGGGDFGGGGGDSGGGSSGGGCGGGGCGGGG
ncbi:hypothetical protein GCM10023259_072640 [Thermocatellispora tengchongensis]